MAPMAPIIILTGWLHALRLMHEGYWSTRLSPGYFASTQVAPLGPIFEVSREGMVYLVRHGFGCTHLAQWWCGARPFR